MKLPRARKWIVVSLVMCVSFAWAEMHTFSLPDGRSIEAEILTFNAKAGQVELKLKNGKRKKIKPTVFVEKDQEYIQEWASLEGFRNTSKFQVECEEKTIDKWKEDGEIEQKHYEKIAFDVHVENRNNNTIENIVINYRIFYEQEVNDHSTKKVVARKKNKSGKLKVESIRPKEKLTLTTKPVTIHEYEFNTSDWYRPGGDPESTAGEVKGIWLRLKIKTASGLTLTREVFKPSSIKGKYVWDDSSDNHDE